jgi:hypothetical protein
MLCTRPAAVDAAVEGVKITLDVGGLVPGVGIVPDVISAMSSAGQGNDCEALFSLACAVPFWGETVRLEELIREYGNG